MKEDTLKEVESNRVKYKEEVKKVIYEDRQKYREMIEARKEKENLLLDLIRQDKVEPNQLRIVIEDAEKV
jgi:hypothetical protein